MQHDVFLYTNPQKTVKKGGISWICLFDFCLGFGHFADLFRIKCKPWFRGNGKDISVGPFEATPNTNEERQGYHKFEYSGILREKTSISDSEIQKNMGNPSKPIYIFFLKISAPSLQKTSKKSTSGCKTKILLL